MHMSYPVIELRLWRQFVAVAEELHFGHAARRLHMTQPGVTGALRRLRDHFGDELLVQSGRQMLLTPRAESLQQPVRRVLLQIRGEILTPPQFDAATAQREYSVVASDYLYDILFCSVMAEAARQAPGLRFRLMPPGREAVERIERGALDLLFTIVGSESPRLSRRRLFRDEDVVISWRDAGRRNLDAEQYFAAGHAVAQFGSDHDVTAPLPVGFDQTRSRRIEVVVPTFAALPGAVVGTQRLATMHRLYAEHFAMRYPITLHACPVALPPIVEIMQWHDVRGLDPGLQWLMALVMRHAQTLPAHARITASAVARRGKAQRLKRKQEPRAHADA